MGPADQSSGQTQRRLSGKRVDLIKVTSPATQMRHQMKIPHICTHWVASLQGQVCGLCGNYDGRSKNDFTTRSNEVVADVQEFGNSWKILSTCNNSLQVTDPCLSNPYRKAYSQKRCNIINSATFESCHSQVIMETVKKLTWIHTDKLFKSLSFG